jgi:hypothetical protein
MGNLQDGNKVITRIVASGQISARPCYIFTSGLAAGSDTATAVIYNNTAGSGTVVDELTAIANTGDHGEYEGVFLDTGCYVVLTGTAPSFSIVFKPI